MSNTIFLLNDKQMSNKVGFEHQPVLFRTRVDTIVSVLLMFTRPFTGKEKKPCSQPLAGNIHFGSSIIWGSGIHGFIGNNVSFRGFVRKRGRLAGFLNYQLSDSYCSIILQSIIYIYYIDYIYIFINIYIYIIALKHWTLVWPNIDTTLTT